ncbi:MAG TPA: phage tail tape measure protein [Prevotella sp.]|nr:phage tail tape measure protein [Prevotella sp.]
MANSQEFTTIIKLNDAEAKNKLEQLTQKVNDLKAAKEKALASGEKISFIKDLNSDLKKANSELRSYTNNVSKTLETLQNIGTKSLGQLESARRSLYKAQKEATTTEEYQRMQEYIDKVTDRIDVLKHGISATIPETENLANVMSKIKSVSLNQLTGAKNYLEKSMVGMNVDSTSYATSNNQLKEINARIQEIRENQKSVNSAVEQYNLEMHNVGQEEKQVATDTQLINRTLKNLSTSSVKDLQYSLKMVTEQMQNMNRGTRAFKTMSDQAQRLRTELEKVRAEGVAQQSWINKVANWFNRMQTLIFSLAATVTGLSMAIRKSVDAYAQMDQEMTNVRKYTGQSAQEIERMNEDFKQMDTRTGREQLNQFADAAGRLGITSTKSIEEFVDAADKISVSLGDDLGDGAVEQIGKLAQAFGQDKTMGLRGAMIATGSAVNDLAQSSSANAGYIVDFTSRLAGIGLQAHLSQQNIMGFGSVLDQNMQNVETSATAVSQLITKIYQDPAKFAKLAGENVKKFSNLLKTDANQALLTFLAAMKDRGGFSGLAKMFDEMGLDGTRCVGVLSTLATKLKDVQVAQHIANQSYAKGTSVLNEFNIQNSSVQAQMDKAKKNFKEITIALGQELLPVVRYTISGAGLTVRALYNIITATKPHINGILKLSAVLLTLTAIYKAHTIATYAWYVKEEALFLLEKVETAFERTRITVITALKVAYYLLTGQLAKAKEAMIVLNTVAKENPYGVVIAVVAALAAGITALILKIKNEKDAIEQNTVAIKSAKAAHQDMLEAQKQMNQNTANAKSKLTDLTNIINSNVYSYGEKKRAMIALEKIVPGYHRNLANEAGLTKANNKALAEYVSRLNDAAMAQALYDRMVALRGKQFDLQQEISRHNNSAKHVQSEINRHPEKYNATTTSTYTTGFGSTMIGNTVATKDNYLKHQELENWVKLSKEAGDNLKVVNSEVTYINNYMAKNKGVREQYQKLIESTDTTYSPSKLDSGSGKYIDPKAEKAAEKERKKREREHEAAVRKLAAAQKKEMNKELKNAKDQTDKEEALNILSLTNREETYRQYIEKQHQLTIAGLNKRIAILKKFGQNYNSLTKEVQEEQKKADEDHTKLLQRNVEANYQKEVAMAHEAYNNRNDEAYKDDDALNQRLFEAQQSYLVDKMATEKKYSDEWLNDQDEMDRNSKEFRIQQEEDYERTLDDWRQEYGRQDFETQMKETLRRLDKVHTAKLASEQEYQELRKQMILKYDQAKAEQDKNHSVRELTDANAQSAEQTASDEASASEGSQAGTSVGQYLFGDIKHYQDTMANLKQLYKDDNKAFQEFQEAKAKAFEHMCEGIATKMKWTYDQVSTIMTAESSYYSAESNYQEAITRKKYDKRIDAASNNSAKKKKLQDKEEKEIAAIKRKYDKKTMKMELAKATVEMVMGAMSAYTSTMENAPWPANLTLAPISAAIATAAGMINIATIKKQHAAEEAGYYYGGFTAGTNYTQEAGVVHQGEFVANHQAVNNTNILPALRLIDQAQRNNTIGHITAEDVERTLGVGSAVVSAPQVNINTDNSQLQEQLTAVSDALGKLNKQLDNGITAVASIDGRNGIAHQLDRYNKLKNNV